MSKNVSYVLRLCFCIKDMLPNTMFWFRTNYLTWHKATFQIYVVSVSSWTLRRRLPTGISAYSDPLVKIILYLMSCQNVCSVPGEWTYAFTGPIRHRWLHTQVGVRKRAYLGRKRALTWTVDTLTQTDYFSLTAVKIWQAVVANVPGLNLLLYLGLNTCEHLCYTLMYTYREWKTFLYLSSCVSYPVWFNSTRENCEINMMRFLNIHPQGKYL